MFHVFTLIQSNSFPNKKYKMYKNKYTKYTNKYLKLLSGGTKINDDNTIEIDGILFDIVFDNIDKFENIRRVTITQKKMLFKMTFNLYSICKNKLFAELTEMNYGAVSCVIFSEILKLFQIEYIVDTFNKIIEMQFCSVISFLNNNIIVLNTHKDKYENLLNFDVNIGICTNYLKKMDMEIDYSINLMWINENKENFKCMLATNKDTYILNGIKKNYTHHIEEKINSGITNFQIDGFNIDLNTMTYAPNGSDNPQKIFKCNHMENLKMWSILHPKNKINMWYDREFTKVYTIINTLLNINDFNETSETMGIYLRDIRNLNSFMTLEQNIFNPIPFGYKIIKNNFVRIVNQLLPIYYRVDFARLMIMNDILKENTYYIYSDLDCEPVPIEKIFNFYLYDRNIYYNIQESLKIIDLIGFMPCVINGISENGFTIFGSSNPEIKKHVLNYFNSFLKKHNYVIDMDFDIEPFIHHNINPQAMYNSIGGTHMFHEYIIKLKEKRILNTTTFSYPEFLHLKLMFDNYIPVSNFEIV